MMAIATIHDWLNGSKDFKQGLELLKQYNPKHPKIFVFETFGASPAHLRWLEDALSDVNAKDDAKGKGSQPLVNPRATEANGKSNSLSRESTSAVTPLPKGKWFNPEKLSEGLREEYDLRIKALFRERSSVHRLFDPQKPQEHNAQVSNKLRGIQTQLDNFFDRARKFMEDGVEENRGLFARYKTLERAIQCHREYISRRRNKPEMKVKIEERLAEMEKDLQEFEKLEERLYEIT